MTNLINYIQSVLRLKKHKNQPASALMMAVIASGIFVILLAVLTGFSGLLQSQSRRAIVKTQLLSVGNSGLNRGMVNLRNDANYNTESFDLETGSVDILVVPIENNLYEKTVYALAYVPSRTAPNRECRQYQVNVTLFTAEKVDKTYSEQNSPSCTLTAQLPPSPSPIPPSPSPPPTPTPQVLYFCVYDKQQKVANDQDVPITTAFVEPDPPDNSMIKNQLSPPDNVPYLRVNSAGCTNPYNIDYTKVSEGTQYTYVAKASGYQDLSLPWVWVSPISSMKIYLDPVATPTPTPTPTVIGSIPPSPSPTPTPTPQDKVLKFCVFDDDAFKSNGSDVPVQGAYINTNPPSNNLQDKTLPAPDNVNYLRAGADGCTNPSFIIQSMLHNNASFTSDAGAEGFMAKTLTWQWSGNEKIVKFYLPKKKIVFCVYDDKKKKATGQDVPLKDMRVYPDARVIGTSDTTPIIKPGVPSPNTQQYLMTGTDGCTSADSIDYTWIKDQDGFYGRADAFGYSYLPQTGAWYYREPSIVKKFYLSPYSIRPQALAVDNNKNIYVGGFTNASQVRKYDATGKLCNSLNPTCDWGFDGDGTGVLSPVNIKKIVVDSAGSSYILGRTTGNTWSIQKLGPNGKACNDANATCSQPSPWGNIALLPGRIAYSPTMDIAVDGANNLYVGFHTGQTDGRYVAVRKYTSQGALCDGGSGCNWGTGGEVRLDPPIHAQRCLNCATTPNPRHEAYNFNGFGVDNVGNVYLSYSTVVAQYYETFQGGVYSGGYSVNSGENFLRKYGTNGQIVKTVTTGQYGHYQTIGASFSPVSTGNNRICGIVTAHVSAPWQKVRCYDSSLNQVSQTNINEAYVMTDLVLRMNNNNDISLGARKNPSFDSCSTVYNCLFLSVLNKWQKTEQSFTSYSPNPTALDKDGYTYAAGLGSNNELLIRKYDLSGNLCSSTNATCKWGEDDPQTGQLTR